MTSKEIVVYIQSRLDLVEMEINQYQDDDEKISSYDQEVLMRYLYVKHELEAILEHIKNKELTAYFDNLKNVSK